MLKSPELLKEFYNEIKDEYPDLDIQQVTEVVNSPWKMLRKTMETGELDTIRFKYFGIFQVYTKRAEKMLTRSTKAFKDLKLEPVKYFKIKEILEKFLKRRRDEEAN